MIHHLKRLGPGLLYAGAAIGVSHLVQSTRAGADYGLSLLWVIVVAHLFKYPFFQFGPLYAAATGNTLLHGYKDLGKWALILFIGLTLSTFIIVESAIVAVTAGMAENLFQFGFSNSTWGFILLLCCASILIVGKFKLLNQVVKGFVYLLSLTTVIALLSAFYKGGCDLRWDDSFSWLDSGNILFLIAFLGWMPAPMDISVWHSVWSVEAQKNQQHSIGLKSVLFDFNIGFFGTAILACCFLLLGAIVLHPEGLRLSASAVGFSKEFTQIYTQTLGSWAFFVIAIAAFSTMFSTAITCLDAFPRVLSLSHQLLLDTQGKNHYFKSYKNWLYITVIFTFIVVLFLMENMRQMVDFATTISFLTTPIIAWLNYKVIFQSTFNALYVPSFKIKWLSLLGMVFLLGFALFYFGYRLELFNWFFY